jgi:hypothetical protein
MYRRLSSIQIVGNVAATGMMLSGITTISGPRTV